MKLCTRMIKKYGHWIFLGLMILITVYMDVYVANNFLDGDASQPLLRGWVGAQQKNPFTSDVYLTTEVRFIGTSTIATLFFTFFTDWTLVRILTMLFKQGWYLLAFLFLCKQSAVRKPQAIYAAGMLLLPVSIPYARIVLYHMYYLLNIANMFWIMGLTARLVSAADGQKRIGTWILLGVSWLMAGLEGIRYMMIIGVPMLAYLVFDILHTLKNYRWDNGRLIGEMPVSKTNAFVFLRIMLVACICFLAGYVLNQAVLLNIYDVGNSSQSWYWAEAQTLRYADIFHGWLKANGIRTSFQQLIGIRGITLVASLVFFCYMIGASVRGLPGSGLLEKKKPEQNLIRGLYAASLLITTLVFCFDSVYRLYELYYLPVVALSFPLLAQEMDAFQERSTSASRKLLLVAVCACVLFQGVYSWYFIRVDKDKLDVWGGLSYTEMDTVDQVRDCVDYMQENGYTHGLIDYWYASPMIEMTDGSLKVAPLEGDYKESGALEIYRWGTFKSAFYPENMPEKIVVFIKREECASFEQTFPTLSLVHEGWIFNGYEADSSLIQ